jgi:hypothetical protein
LRRAELPVNKNLLVLDREQIKLEGLVVCAPPLAPATQPRVFLPAQAVERILGRSAPLPPVSAKP